MGNLLKNPHVGMLFSDFEQGRRLRLQGIATIQKDMGEYVEADGTFAEAARIYERLGMPRDAALARRHRRHATEWLDRRDEAD